MLIFTLFFAFCGCIASEDIIVNLPNGPLKGETFPEFYVFKGIPYAEPPIGAKRFEPVGLFRGTWNDVRDATEFEERCLQWREDVPQKLGGQEDCLFLNVYTSHLSDNLPVIVHFHGGGFMYGSGTFFSPEHMLHLHKIVFVTVNYRLGPLGFLSTEDDVVPGNMGLKDQVVALQWVKENIHLFGGDPNSVTLSGFSAGGASTHLHYLSPQSSGLFHRGISHSGCALNPWVLAENSREKTKFLANHLGCPTDNTKEMIECLKQKSGEDIVSAVQFYQPWVGQPFSPFGVVVEYSATDPFLAAHPEVLYKTDKVAKLPWIVGYTNADGLFPTIKFLEPTILEELGERWIELAPIVLDYNGTVSRTDLDDLSQRIYHYYLGTENLSRQTFDSLVKMATDRVFASGIGQCARLHGDIAPTYLFTYNFPGNFGITQLHFGIDAKMKGAAHGDDVFVLLRNRYDSRAEQTPEEKEMCRLLTEMYTSFMQDSQPKLGDVTFEEINSHGFASYLNINSPTNISMAIGTNIGEQTFWESLPIDESGIPKGTSRNTVKGEL
uniref:Carboxylic ester hydrolase n=1 Tax=Nyssomyia neivai TaxID=330878 RepID=A0A1L8DJ77_9DIPT